MKWDNKEFNVHHQSELIVQENKVRGTDALTLEQIKSIIAASQT